MALRMWLQEREGLDIRGWGVAILSDNWYRQEEGDQ
jgi:hypothetical protein